MPDLDNASSPNEYFNVSQTLWVGVGRWRQDATQHGGGCTAIFLCFSLCENIKTPEGMYISYIPLHTPNRLEDIKYLTMSSRNSVASTDAVDNLVKILAGPAEQPGLKIYVLN